jgi:hypothetical protein
VGGQEYGLIWNGKWTKGKQTQSHCIESLSFISKLHGYCPSIWNLILKRYCPFSRIQAVESYCPSRLFCVECFQISQASLASRTPCLKPCSTLREKCRQTIRLDTDACKQADYLPYSNTNSPPPRSLSCSCSRRLHHSCTKPNLDVDLWPEPGGPCVLMNITASAQPCLKPA